jgi:hypothetical protein
LPPFTPVSSASSIRSVHTEGSTHAQRARMSPTCLALWGTAVGRSSFVVSIPVLSSCRSFAPSALPDFFATMPALTSGLGFPSEAGHPCFTHLYVWPFRHHTPWAPCCRFITLPLSATGFPVFSGGWTSPLLRRLVAFQAALCSSSYGPVIHLTMLPTPPLGGCSFVRFRAGERMPGADFHRSVQVRPQAHVAARVPRADCEASVQAPPRHCQLGSPWRAPSCLPATDHRLPTADHPRKSSSTAQQLAALCRITDHGVGPVEPVAALGQTGATAPPKSERRV